MNVQTMITQIYIFYDIKSDIQSPNRQHINLIQTIFTTNSSHFFAAHSINSPVRSTNRFFGSTIARSRSQPRARTRKTQPRCTFRLFFWGPSVLRRSKHTTIKRVSWSLTTRAGRRRGLLRLVKKQESEQTRGCFAYFFFFFWWTPGSGDTQRNGRGLLDGSALRCRLELFFWVRFEVVLERNATRSYTCC